MKTVQPKRIGGWMRVFKFCRFFPSGFYWRGWEARGVRKTTRNAEWTNEQTVWNGRHQPGHQSPAVFSFRQCLHTPRFRMQIVRTARKNRLFEHCRSPLSVHEAKSLVAGEANGENTSRQVMPRSAAVAHSQAHLLIFTLPSPLMNSHVTSN